MANYLFRVEAMNRKGQEVTSEYVSANQSGINAIMAARDDGLFPTKCIGLGETSESVTHSLLKFAEMANPDIDLCVAEQEFLRREIAAGRMRVVS